ncbi:response regulator [Salinispira pacifica]|uniref:Phosphate regulon transcriptional regulatory protein PhoB (SphR) n=1 Tax=Salinispira pacifica TaxID=1307761 RepID=V5WET7_9SPIO|nr:response regulator [Salinispira pacifica]AHC14333.1 Phosphate regulon transcriptional regulatory protein PhoB (SphR) [Salinispira pacifica]
MAKESILCVEDEPDILELIRYNLEREGYTVFTADTGEKGLSMAASHHPALILLDLMLPGLDGLEVCRRLKKDHMLSHIPVIMLTAKTEDSDIITGLEVGADDYLSKPFSPKVLIARIRSVLRRVRGEVETLSQEDRIKIHDILIDVSRHEVFMGAEAIDLSATEFAILEFLARSPGWVFSRNKIIDAVKGKDYPVTERSVDVQILGLRKKLGTHGDYIETVRGVGYRMKPQEE